MSLLPQELTGEAPPAPHLADELRALGLPRVGPLFHNLTPPRLVEQAISRNEGILTDAGAFVAYTGARTGRSPDDKFIVRDAATENEVAWGGFNHDCTPEFFDHLFRRVCEHLAAKELFVADLSACADPAYRLNARVVCEHAWHALFSRCLFRRPEGDELANYRPDWHVLHAPGLALDPATDGSKSDVAVAVHFPRKLVLIAGTHYAGEIKKSIFGVLNYLLPQSGVFPMHCSANVGQGGDVALFFGLSGTGKTTLSADPARRLIGDDEHGWADTGVFNLEGGCYAKTIHLSPHGEPQIYQAIRFGSVLENVPLDARTRRPDYDSLKYTENTRAAYPVEYIPNCDLTGRGGHPETVVFLTCDAFGVLPPISKLTPAQALYHFLSGYTAKTAGTEVGVKEPSATFSTCFGAPFLPLAPVRYAELLRQRLEKHSAPVWLVNTGWTGGAAGVGLRMPLAHTRAMLTAALTGALANVPCTPDPFFGVQVPKAVRGVPPDLLTPRLTWGDHAAYEAKARDLAQRFRTNFKKYEATAADDVKAAGPMG